MENEKHERLRAILQEIEKDAMQGQAPRMDDFLAVVYRDVEKEKKGSPRWKPFRHWKRLLPIATAAILLLISVGPISWATVQQYFQAIPHSEQSAIEKSDIEILLDGCTKTEHLTIEAAVYDTYECDGHVIKVLIEPDTGFPDNYADREGERVSVKCPAARMPAEFLLDDDGFMAYIPCTNKVRAYIMMDCPDRHTELFVSVIENFCRR